MTAANPDSPQATELPALECDLVMKGGITSGLVYPKAVVRVARDYRIRDIGGTSIGAIAAALTAAAEYWRHAHPTAAGVQQAKIDTLFRDLPDNPTEAELIEHLDAREGQFIGGGPNDTGRDVRGFAGLYQIPKEVGADLMGKFQPQFWTSGLFTFAIGLMGLSNPVALLAYVLFRRFVLVRTILAAVFVLVAITARLNPLHGKILLGLVLVLALLGYLVFFGISLKKAGKPAWKGPWIGLTMYTVVTTAALAICWVVPDLPDPPEVWS
ncbi:MAG TPA: hypothetical protein VD767_03835, partial [Thermomicrobiales bacterium]|nr:hypothetical protein [Thermomicrobiales bacterium]